MKELLGIEGKGIKKKRCAEKTVGQEYQNWVENVRGEVVAVVEKKENNLES